MIQTRRVALFGLLLALLLPISGPASSACADNSFNDFETNTGGWNLFSPTSSPNNAVREPNSFENIPASVPGSQYYALAPQHAFEATPNPLPGSAQTNFGGYSSNFGSGFASSVDIYLNVAGDTSGPWANDTRFAWDSAINTSGGGFLRDFVFNGGFYTANSIHPDEFVIDAENNTGRASSYPGNPAYDPFAITATGWYTFKEYFYNNNGTLEVTMSIWDAHGNELHFWNVNKANDAIATVGGNNYGWFASNEFRTLPFDNVGLSYATSSNIRSFFADANVFTPAPEPSSLALGTLAVSLIGLAWRRREPPVLPSTVGGDALESALCQSHARQTP